MRLLPAALLLPVLLLATACASTAPSASAITAEGLVSVRGNEPFTELVLETDMRNRYVLRLDAAEATRLAAAVPARVRVTGPVHAGTWNGQPHAVLTVQTWALVE